MMGRKTLSEIKAELAVFLSRLPGKSPKAWLEKEIKSARSDPTRSVETLEMILHALESEVKKQKQKNKPRKRTAKV